MQCKMSCLIKNFKVSRYLETWLLKKSKQYISTLDFQGAFSIMHLLALRMQILLIQSQYEHPEDRALSQPY